MIWKKYNGKPDPNLNTIKLEFVNFLKSSPKKNNAKVHK